MKKKIFWIAIIVALILVTIAVSFIYTKTNKVVATRNRSVISYLDGKEMKYEDIREFYFKKDVMDRIVVTYDYEDIKNSDKMYNEYKGIMQTLIKNYNLNMDIKQDNQKIIMEFDIASFKEFFGEDYSNINEEKLKQVLEHDGFEIK